MKWLKKYGESLVALGIALAILLFVLWQLDQHFSGNFVGQLAGKAGSYVSGQAYNF